MKEERFRSYQLQKKEAWPGGWFNTHREVQRGQSYAGAPVAGLLTVLRRLLAGFHKIFVALKYQFFRWTVGLFEDVRLPWVRIGLAALAVFILLKKDVQFSINMRAPLSPAAADDREGRAANTRLDEMSLAAPFRTSAPASARYAAAFPDQLDAEKVQAYIDRFARVASAEMDKFGIPASIKMGMAVIESHGGDHPAARQTNNHFGPAMNGRSYNNAWENWRAHSELLQRQYPELWRQGLQYKKWARALRSLGYSPDPDYDRKLLDAIERFRLYRLDEI